MGSPRNRISDIIGINKILWDRQVMVCGWISVVKERLTREIICVPGSRFSFLDILNGP